ncbi:MAG: hypothetical protein CFH01_00746, partial [Alphaproteobacteria bacterium MarineAlpha2_Bin1]
LNYFLIQYFQHVGLAIATAISSWFNVVLLSIILIYKNWWIPDYNLIKTIVKILFSSLIMVLFLIFTKVFIINENLEYFNKISILILLVLSGLLVYMLISKILKVMSFVNLKSNMKKSN